MSKDKNQGDDVEVIAVRVPKNVARLIDERRQAATRGAWVLWELKKLLGVK